MLVHGLPLLSVSDGQSSGRSKLHRFRRDSNTVADAHLRDTSHGKLLLANLCNDYADACCCSSICLCCRAFLAVGVSSFFASGWTAGAAADFCARSLSNAACALATSFSASAIRSSILRVSEGQIWANTEQLDFLLDLISEVPSLRVLNVNGSRLLTPREEQVVALVAEGLGNRQIAVELNLSEHTIKKYLFRIFEKLGVSTRVELVLYAMNNGDPRSAEWLMGAPRFSPLA